jgi:hypothetical protein
MTFNSAKLETVANEAKAAGNARWAAAIDKALAGLTGAWIVTELVTGVLITTEKESTYFVSNGHCGCDSAAYGKPCLHRAGARLIELYNAKQETTPALVSTPNAGILVRPERGGVRIDSWMV